MIEIKGVTVVFGRTVALSSIELDLEPGITGLFGQNGSGKSTLLRTIAGLIKPTEGTVLVDGHAFRRGDESARSAIGFAGHETGLYARLTLKENLELFARLYGTATDRISLTLEQLGLNEEAAVPVGSLSAGMKRRAAVARAMLHDPDVLLLDEPYANLDDESAERISALVRAWNSDDRLALVATHGARRLKAFARTGLILRQGIVASYRPYEHG